MSTTLTANRTSWLPKPKLFLGASLLSAAMLATAAAAAGPHVVAT